MENFLNKVALVTGAGSGIGRASAICFAREGVKVVVADINATGGNRTVQMIRDNGGQATYISSDVSKSTEVKQLIDKTIHLYHRLDFAHNNAGIVSTEPLTHEISEDAWDRVLSVNLKGVWLCMKYEIPQMLKLGKGAIVNTSSVVGLIGNLHFAAYAASKHGVNGVTKVAALEYAKQGIRINSVCPGIISTPGLKRDIKDTPGLADLLVQKEPIGRMGKAEEIAETVVWLCSDAASFVTGHCMAVDGGLTTG